MVVIFFAPKFSFAKIDATFRLEMGQQIGLRRGSSFFGQIPSFRPPKWHFFQNFRFGGRFFFAPKFSLRQISATFRLEIGRWGGLQRRIFIFQPNSIVSVYEIAFFKTFRFGARFFFVPKFSFA